MLYKYRDLIDCDIRAAAQDLKAAKAEMSTLKLQRDIKEQEQIVMRLTQRLHALVQERDKITAMIYA